MFLIGSIPVTPDSLYGTLGVLCFVLTIAVQVVTIIRARQPQPFLVRGETQYAKQEDLVKVSARVDALQRDLQVEMTELRTAVTDNYNKIMESQSTGRSRIYTKIEDVSASVHRMEGVLETLSKSKNS